MTASASAAHGPRLDIGIVGGTGREGTGLSLRWARAGHRVFIGSRDAARGRERAAELAAEQGVELQGGSNEEAAAHGAVVVLAVPYGAHGPTLASLAGALDGRVVVDITVPLKPPQVRRVHLPAGGAAALEAQAALGGGAKVVATLHHTSSDHLGDPDHGLSSDVLICGDDAEARAQVADLIRDLGAFPVDAGVLANAVALEAMTPVLLHINKHYGVVGAGLRVTGLARPG